VNHSINGIGIFGADLLARLRPLIQELAPLGDEERLAVINAVRLELNALSPLAAEPVDCVLWVDAGAVESNDYNPNNVSPPEMRLLERSIEADGYTQPIVCWPVNGHYEVIDGFHRNRVGKESAAVRSRLHGYLPITVINAERQDRGDRIAATIRHNRARGKHQVEAMSDIVLELKRRNWSDEKIGNELGMDPDEVLRLTQIQGLAEMFKDRAFSEAWEAAEIHAEDDLEILEENADGAVTEGHQEGLSPLPEA